MDSSLALILLAAAAGIAWFWFSRRRRAHAAEEQLRRICMGDRRQVERLIESEMTRAPGISRAEAASRAVGRYRRDNS